MSQIKVKVRTDIGDPGIHPRLGKLVPGSEVLIDEAEFGAALFERPTAKFLSTYEQSDKARAADEKRQVGNFAAPEPKTIKEG